MKEITLKSPKILQFDTKNGINCKLSHQMFTDTKLGIELPVNFSIFMNLQEKGIDGRFILPLEASSIFGVDTVQLLNNIKITISQCSQISELLFAKLKKTNQVLKNTGLYDSLFEPYNERYIKLDFMGHRNIISEILQTKKSDNLKAITDIYNVKSVTTSFYNLILDRNKYTHGELLTWYPERKTILEYEENISKQIEYGEVNKDILNSYVLCCKELNEFLDLIKGKF